MFESKVNLNDHFLGCHVDWLSYTLLDTIPTTNQTRAIHHSEKFLALAFENYYEKYFTDAEWGSSGTHKPYSRAIASNHGIALYYGDVPHQKVEIQARACVAMANDGILHGVANRVYETVKRLDVAIDFDGSEGLRAEKIASMALSKRIRSRASKISDSGETYYIGSQDSERFVRVYEYNAPHERAGKPRIEFVLRNSQAQVFIDYWNAYGLHEAAQMIINVFDFEGLRIANMDEKLPTKAVERTHGKTVRWLIKQCAPAFKKLVREGVINDPVEFFNNHFMPATQQMTRFNITEDENVR